MKRRCHTLGLFALALLGMAGCQASRWSASTASAPTAVQTPPAPANAIDSANQSSKSPPAAATSRSAASGASIPAGAAAASSGPVDPQAMQRVMAELQQAGTLDPASRDRLIQDLQQTDPSLWPLVMQQFRAALAYRQQVEQRHLAGANAGSDTTVPGSAATVAPAGANLSENRHAGEDRLASRPDRRGVPSADGSAVPASTPASAQPASAPPAAAQPASTTGAANTGAPPSAGSSSTKADTVSAKVDTSHDATSKVQADSNVKQAACQAEVHDDSRDEWRTHLAAAIRAREGDLRDTAKTPADEARQAQLRMLYLLAGRRDDALKTIPSASPAVQNFWSAELYGLSLWMDAERTPDASRRAADAREHLNDALLKLGDSCPLVVRNMAFCSKITSYGCVKPFEPYVFSPGQTVLLYAEVENLGSETTPQGAHTSLHSSYQVFDSRGQRVTEQDFPDTEEFCRNVRRDYFVDYEFRLPERIYPGKHTLQLTIEDLKSKKVGQSTIEFTIKK